MLVADFADDIELASSLYKLGENGEWTAYVDGVTVKENTTVFFRAIDAAGNESEIVSYTVNNIDKTAPETPVATADITTPINGDVLVTATFSKDSVSREYSLDGENWATYVGGVLFTSNRTAYFRSIDAVGNISEVASYTVTNIDRTAPEKPSVSVDITTLTNQSVSVSATFDDDSFTKEYSLDGKTWKAYSDAIEFVENGTVYFRGTDEAGNESEIVSYTVDNIDKIPPEAPTATASISEMTNQDVIVTASFSKDSITREYSLDGENWKDYTEAIKFTDNGSVSFRGTDEAGNVSEITSYEVNNIDRIAPETPVPTADITTPTNGDVLVTATFSKDSAVKEYSLDGVNWAEYAGGVLFGSNRTAYFRSIDAADNISEVASYTVTNIDRTAPAKPIAVADITTPTNKSVNVSATFDEDSFTKEYSLDGEEWHPYTKTLLLAKNETVSFRGTDEAGNTSEVASLEVNNIDTVAPTDPTGLTTIVSDQTVVLIWSASTDDFSGVKEYVITYSLDEQESITVRTNGTSYVLTNAEFGSYSWNVQAMDFAGNASAVTPGDAFVVSGFKPYTVEYSADNFEHVITFAVTTPELDAFRMPTGTYQMRVKQDGSSEWMTGDPIVASETDIEPQLIKSDADSNADVFFANPIGTWESGYMAQHVGATADSWGGTQEYATLYGKNKLADIIEGSTDANILLMTDDENGDTLFVDDIYTALPGSVTEQQSRIAQIDEIRAGFGNDIVDMTSQQFEYIIGNGLIIRGGAGNDTIWSNKGDNKLFGDAGNDRIVGASGNDVIAGGIGNDRMHGGGGDDIFTFCDNWGVDSVEQLAGGSVTLWFASGDESKWNKDTLTYTDGDNSVKVTGVSEVALKFGDDGSDQFATLSGIGAFFDATSVRIFEESGKGILANL